MTAAVDRVEDVRPTTSSPNALSRIDVGRLFTHLALLFLVVLWTFPTAGLLISSLRDKDQLAVSGWWTALTDSVSQEVTRLPTAEGAVEENGQYVIRGSIFGESTNKSIATFGLTANELAAAEAGGSLPMREGGTITVFPDGTYEWVSETPFEHTRGPRVFYVAEIAPRFTIENYVEVLTASGVGRPSAAAQTTDFASSGGRHLPSSSASRGSARRPSYGRGCSPAGEAPTSSRSTPREGSGGMRGNSGPIGPAGFWPG